MRVSVVSPYNPRPTPGHDEQATVGGVERALDAIAEALQEAGADVTLHCTSATAGLDVRPSGLRVARERRIGTMYRAPFSRLAFRALRDADVVHVPATYPSVSDLVPLLARSRGVPCVLDYHFDVHGVTPGMRRAASAYGATFGRAMRLADRVLVKTSEYRAQSPVASRFPDEKVRVVPNGVDAKRFDVSEARSNGVLVVGRLVPYKGVETAIRAMQIVQRDFDAPLVIAGNGPCRPTLESLARDLGVDARFMGFAPEDELPRLYARARLTLLTSANGQEAFGITLIESMAAGTPVVASDLPGVRTVAALGGVTAPPNDAEAFARAIRAVLKGEAGLPGPEDLKRRVRETYDWSAVARSCLAVYEDAIAERRGA